MKLSTVTRSVFWVVVINYLKRDIFKKPKLGQATENKYVFNIVYVKILTNNLIK